MKDELIKDIENRMRKNLDELIRTHPMAKSPMLGTILMEAIDKHNEQYKLALFQGKSKLPFTEEEIIELVDEATENITCEYVDNLPD